MTHRFQCFFSRFLCIFFFVFLSIITLPLQMRFCVAYLLPMRRFNDENNLANAVYSLQFMRQYGTASLLLYHANIRFSIDFFNLIKSSASQTQYIDNFSDAIHFSCEVT
eukprot:123223_1